LQSDDFSFGPPRFSSSLLNSKIVSSVLIAFLFAVLIKVAKVLDLYKALELGGTLLDF